MVFEDDLRAACHQKIYIQPLALSVWPLPAKNQHSQLPVPQEPFRGEKKYSPLFIPRLGCAIYQVKKGPGLPLDIKLSLSFFDPIFGFFCGGEHVS